VSFSLLTNSFADFKILSLCFFVSSVFLLSFSVETAISSAIPAAILPAALIYPTVFAIFSTEA